MDIGAYGRYMEALRKWNGKINLVSKDSLDDMRERHFEDSLALLPFLSEAKNIFDVGSGAGFPGMALAIAGADVAAAVESDARKCAFLNEIKRLYSLKTEIINDRVENIGLKAGAITGRAFAPLEKFLGLCRGITTPDTKMILLKGHGAEDEIKRAKNNWSFRHALYPKKDGFVLEVWNIKPESNQ
jgi:16S rRNA (guanine527-N7)-methyltransferase